MAHTPPPSPPSGPPSRKHSQSVQPIQREDDFQDFESDATNVNQMPHPGAPAQGTPRPQPSQMHAQHPASQPPHFAAPSPQLSPVGNTPPPPQGMYTPMQQASGMQQIPGPPMSQVSGVIAQPTP